MRTYNEILVWENNRRLKRLNDFRIVVEKYFQQSSHHWMNRERTESPESEAVRATINRHLDEIHSILICAGVGVQIRYTPSATRGGYVQDIDILENIFNLHHFQIGANQLLDIIDRGIGVYETDHKPAVLRTINPIFYLQNILNWVVMIPFNLIGKVGFNQKKIENSMLGRLFKASIYIVTALASFLTVLQLIDLLDLVKALFK